MLITFLQSLPTKSPFHENVLKITRCRTLLGRQLLVQASQLLLGELFGLIALRKAGLIQEDVDLPRTAGRLLAEHDVGRHTAHVIKRGTHGCIEEVLGSLLKGRLRKHTRLRLRDAEAVHGHDPSRIGHRVCKEREVMLVHGLLREDLVELLEERQARGLNSEDVHNLVNVVRGRAGGVHAREHRKLLEIGTLHIQHLERLADLATHAAIAHKLVLDLAKLETPDVGISGDHHLQKAFLHAATDGLNADLVRRKELEANRQVTLGVDQRTGDLDLLREFGRQLLRLQSRLNERHIQDTTADKLGGIQLHTNDPRTTHTIRLHREPFVVLEDFAVLLQNGLTWSHRILVDPHRLRNLTQGRLLDFTHLVDGRLLRMLEGGFELQGVAWALRVLGGIQQLLNTRDTRRRIGLSRTRRVEGVERELRRGLTNGLCRKRADHLPRMNLGLDVAEPNVAHELLKEHLGHAMHDNGLLGSQVEPKQRMEQTVPRELGLELGELGDHIGGREIGLRGLRVAVLLNEARDVHWRQDHVIALLATEGTAHDHVAVLHDFVQEIRRLRHGLRKLGVDVVGGQRELLVELLQRHRDRGLGLLLDGRGLDAILALGHLHHGTADRAHGAVLGHVEVLHGLDQSALDVARVRRLDGRINETLTACLRVEEELRGHQTTHEAILNEPTALQTIIKLGEVRKRAFLKRLLNTAPLNQLLTEQGHHLLHVQTTALGSRLDHLHNAVVLGKLGVHVLGNFVRHRFHQRIDLVLELLAIRTTRVVTELACVNALQKLVNLATRIGDGLIYELVGLEIGHEIAGAT